MRDIRSREVRLAAACRLLNGDFTLEVTHGVTAGGHPQRHFEVTFPSGRVWLHVSPSQRWFGRLFARIEPDGRWRTALTKWLPRLPLSSLAWRIERRLSQLRAQEQRRASR